MLAGTDLGTPWGYLRTMNITTPTLTLRGTLLAAATVTATLAAAPAAHATYPGREGRLAFAPGSFSAPAQLFTAQPDGSDLRKVVDGARLSAWSADGRTLAYSAGDGLYVSRADGSEPRRVLAGVYSDFTLSPDGKTLVVAKLLARNENNWIREDLVKVDVATGDESLLTYDADNPTFSPDGRKVAFVHLRLDRYRYAGIGTIGIDGKGRKLVLRATRPPAAGLDWSPSGSTIAFTRQNGAYTDLNLLNARTGSLQRLLHRRSGKNGSGTLAEGSVSWSPTGKRIAIGVWNGRGEYDLATVAVGSGRVTRFGHTGTNPAWQPLR